MSEGKHTPGPWTARQHDVFKWWGVYYQGADGSEVLLINKLTEANARLIAAAPEMRAELKRLYSLYGNEATADVIAKAEGPAGKDQESSR